MNYLFALSTSIRTFRLARNWTQEQFAEFLDISVSQIQHVENGHRKPSLALLYKLYCHGFSIDGALAGEQEDSLLRKNLLALIERCPESQVKDLTAILGVLQKKN